MFLEDIIGPFIRLYGRKYYVNCFDGKIGIVIQTTFYPIEYEENVKYITKDGIKHKEGDMFIADTSDELDILNPTYNDVKIYKHNVRLQYANRYGMEQAWAVFPLNYEDKDAAMEAIKSNHDNLKHVSTLLWQNMDFLAELLTIDVGSIRRHVPNSILRDVMAKIRMIKQENQMKRTVPKDTMAVDPANKEAI